MIENEKISFVENSFNKAFDYYRPDRERLVRNRRMYSGVNNQQWPDDIVGQLNDEGRQIPTYDIIKQKISGLAGQLLRSQYEIKFEPMDTAINSLTLKLQDMWYSDKETWNYDLSFFSFLINFLIQWGAEEMFVAEDESGELGLAYRSLDPTLITLDPFWMSIDPKDMKNLYRTPYLTVDQIFRLYPHKKEELLYEYARQKAECIEYGDNEGSTPYRDLETRWGDQHRLIEHHHMKYIERYWEWDMVNKRFFPETGFKNQSEDDRIAKKHYIEQNNISADMISWKKQKKSVYEVITIAPTLTNRVLLEDKPHYIQIGQIPIFVAAPFKNANELSGIGDMLKTPQENINKYMLMMQELLDKSARGGMFIDPNMFDNDPSRLQQARLKWNRSGARIETAPGALESGRKYIAEFPSSHIPSDLMGFETLMRDWADRLSLQVPAAEGRAEAANETGVLFRSKYEAAVIARGAIDMVLKLHVKNKAEAYMKQAKVTYAGYEKTFAGNPPFVINERVATENGIGIKNDISKLPRHRVSIQFSKSSLDVKTGIREILGTLKQTTQNPLMAAFLDMSIASTLELPEGLMEELKRIYQLIMRTAGTQEVAAMKNAEAQIVQLDQMMAGALQQLGQTGMPKEQVPEQMTMRETTENEVKQGTPEENLQTQQTLEGG